MLRATAPWVLAALAAGVRAQEARWNLPPGGVALYSAQEQVENLLDSRQGGFVPGAQLPLAPVLLQSELDADRLRVTGSPPDLRWVVPMLAFDLRSLRGGKWNVVLPRVSGFGDLVVDGSEQPAANAGEQHFVLRVTSRAVDPLPDEKKAQITQLGFYYDGDLRGTIDLVRRFDPARGAVTAFQGRFQFEGHPSKRYGDRATKCVLVQQWTLTDVKDYRATDFEGRVAKGIRAGIECLRARLAEPDQGEFRSATEPNVHSQGEGVLALTLLTLIACGESPRDPLLAAAFESLKQRDIKQTYCLALAIMAVERSYAPVREREDLIAGVLKAPAPRQPSAADKAVLEEWTRRLLANRDTSVDKGYLARWTYEGGPSFDNSNTQYALLGLWSAQLCGIKFDRTVWFAAASHWLQAQYPAQDKQRTLQLGALKDLPTRDAAGKPRTTAAVTRRAEPRGWAYTLPNAEEAYGSMTCAGIASLTLCAAALDDAKVKVKNPIDAKVDEAIRNGFCWLSRNRSVRWNAGPMAHRDTWYYYWMYAVERACELSRVALIDGWDWYHDGANVLLALQQEGGAFANASLADTCFAILFLKKAQLPVTTGPR